MGCCLGSANVQPPHEVLADPLAKSLGSTSEGKRPWLQVLTGTPVPLNFSDEIDPSTPKPWELADPPEVPVPVYNGTGVGLLFDRRMARHRHTQDRSHPERPMRIMRIYERLEEEGLAQRCIRIPSRRATRAELILKHSEAHVDTMLNVEKMGKDEAALLGCEYNSVYLCPQSTQAALLSCGSVLEGVERVSRGDVASAVCVVRPPGHHAEQKMAMGFCMFANVAVAVAEARRQGWSERTLIVDWDVHHGNGTQHLFEDDGTVLFFSAHRYDNGKFFPSGPGGHYTSHGTGKGEGCSINVPWDVKGCKKAGQFAPGDAEYLEAFARVLLPIAADFQPDLVVVSAGFDSAYGDPLGECRLTPAGYHTLTQQLRGICGGKVVIALEGGYCLDAISSSMAGCVKALLGDDPPPALEPPRTCVPFHSKTIEQVRQHFARWWPSLRDQQSSSCLPAAPEVHVPPAALKGSRSEMYRLLREHSVSAGEDLALLKEKHEAMVFKLEEIPKPLQPASGADDMLRERLYRPDAVEGPPFLLPVIHVASVEHARRNATKAFRAGAHGIWLVNSGHVHNPPDAAMDPPAPQHTNLKTCSGPGPKAGRAQLTALAECFAAVRKDHPDLWIGVNTLQLPAAQAFKWVIDNCKNADSVWLEELPCKVADIQWEVDEEAEQKPNVAVRLTKWLPETQPALKAVKRERQLTARSWQGMVFASVAGPRQEQVHHQQDNAKQGQVCQALLQHAVSLASTACDVVLVSGAANPKAKLQAMGGGAPLAVHDSGFPPKTVEDCASMVDAVFADRSLCANSSEAVMEFDERKLSDWVSLWARVGSAGRATA